jgi:FAD:protein FMN transferase
MMATAAQEHWYRRARPLLGTLVEIGVTAASAHADANPALACEAAFATVAQVQRSLSRFDPYSDISHFHALRAGQAMPIASATQAVLNAAAELLRLSDGDFDISLGSAPSGWRCEGDMLIKLQAHTQLDVGGIAKGYAVDMAVQTLISHGFAAGWVNAGGDLRAFGDVDVPVALRDECSGGLRQFAQLRLGAFATSYFNHNSRSALAHRRQKSIAWAHVSVAAPSCMWADALTKIVAIRRQTADPLLTRWQAQAWLH